MTPAIGHNNGPSLDEGASWRTHAWRRARADLLPWPALRDALRAILRAQGLPPDAVLLVGETAGEREWCEAGRLAGFLPGDRAFAPLPQ